MKSLRNRWLLLCFSKNRWYALSPKSRPDPPHFRLGACHVFCDWHQTYPEFLWNKIYRSESILRRIEMRKGKNKSIAKLFLELEKVAMKCKV